MRSYIWKEIYHENWPILPTEFFETYLTDKEVRRVIEDGKYQLLGTQVPSYSFADLKRLGAPNMRSVVGYVNDNVNLSRFM